MSRLSPCVLRLATSLALALCAACGDPPGKLIGAYGITMHLQQNSCGPGGLPLVDGYRYTAELRADGTHGFWRVPKIGPIDGSYDAGVFSFSYAQTIELGQADAGTLGCTLLREELLTGEVELSDGGVGHAGLGDGGGGDGGRPNAADAGDAAAALAAEAPLQGTHNISFRTNPDGRCANNPGPLGAYEHLPCSATYKLIGTTHKAF